ncbi:ABC transporter ATP-binding protein [Terrihabitans sp. B22-R8]|uniref:ABC transporter ATP-binding protein n=1 Tax=Terrihabitans sp. B22-R8 TaxID=3425128 RepID=UPI00403C5DD7
MPFFKGETSVLVGRLFQENFRLYWRRYAIAFAFMAVVAATTSAMAWFMRDIVNEVFISQDLATLLSYSLFVMGLSIAKGFATYAQDVALSHVGNRVVADLQRKLYRHVLKFSSEFFSRTPSSDLIMRVSGGANAARNVLNTIVVSVGRDFLTLIGLLLVMVIQAPLLSFIAFVIAPLAFWGVVKLVKRINALASSEFKHGVRIVQLLQETVHGIRIIKAFNLSGYMEAQMDEAVLATEDRANKIARLQARSSPLMESLGGIAIALILLYSGWASVNGHQSPGVFMSFLTAMLLAYEPAKRLARLRLNIEASIVGIRMMYTVLDTPSASHEAEGGDTVPEIERALVFQEAGFRYRSDVPVLNGLNLEVLKDQKVALVGPSGGGKSTILALIQRFYDLNEGRILLDGRDIRDFSARALREQIALVSQDTYLFSGTIRENIRIGRLGASDAEVEAAARDAFAHDFIGELDAGYDTDVGENGVQLSGGQRQRIAIARALLKGAPILLLDEATSALDSETERKVQIAFDRLMKGRTTIVIAHRLSTIVNADRIFVIAGGTVLEEGTHHQLLERGGLYKRLYTHQFAGNEDSYGPRAISEMAVPVAG